MMVAPLLRYLTPEMGWQKEFRDPRDFVARDQVVRRYVTQLPDRGQVPAKIDLRTIDDGMCFRPTEDPIPYSSSAVAVLSLYDYFERRTLARVFDGATGFLDAIVRQLGPGTRNTGSLGLRSTLKALKRFGVPPNELWAAQPCDEPLNPLLFGFAKEYEPLVYLRLDPPNVSGRETLTVLRQCLFSGFPVAFGFPLPGSIDQTADIPFRPKLDTFGNGQAVVAIGFDDFYFNSRAGAVLIRTNWGSDWGDGGYGWLPYSFIERQVASDFWTMLRSEWIETVEMTELMNPFASDC